MIGCGRTPEAPPIEGGPGASGVRIRMRRSIAILALAGAALLGARPAAAQENPFSSCRPSDLMFSLGLTRQAIPERPGAFRVEASGQISITCNDMTLLADELVYETDTLDMFATGNVCPTRNTAS